MKILVAEDDRAFAKILSQVLEANGHTVRLAADGDEAWARFQEEPVPIVLSDWTMPGLDGLTLCRNIRRLRADTYTYYILVTGSTAREQYLEAMDAGVDDFLRKPIDQVDLVNRLRVADRILTSTARIRRLESLLPICSYCRRIRETASSWLPLDEYMRKHADAEFSHGICPSCLNRRAEPQLNSLPDP